MKRHIYAFSVIASAILMAAGCQMAELEEITDNSKPEVSEEAADGNYCVTFDCYQEQTRTEFHDNTIWWSAGDAAVFGQYTKVDGAWKIKTVSNKELSESKPTFSINITSFNVPASDTTTAYFSVYPKVAYKGYAATDGIPSPRVTLNSIQRPNAASFDPEADLLISELILSEADTAATSLSLRYTRPCAIGKMSIVNLPSEEAIESISISATKAGIPVTITGNLYYDLQTGTFSDNKTGYCNDVRDLKLDYVNCEISGDMTAYFVCYPFDLVKDDTFSVVVKTKDGNSYSKFITLGEGDELSFKATHGTQFTVDMANAISTGVNWADIKVIAQGTTKLYYSVTGDEADIDSFTRAAFKKSDWLALTPEQQSAKLDSAKVGTVNQKINLTGCAKNTQYIIAAKLKNKSGETAIIMKETGTTWVDFRAVTRSSGGIQAQITCADIAYGTKIYKAVRSTELEGVTDLEDFYTNTVKPANIAQSMVDAINAKGADDTSANYAVTTDYQGNELIPDEPYVVMMKCINSAGEIKFCAMEAIAK